MTDYHQRFRERFDGCLHFVAEEHFPDILVFIDEVVAEENRKGWIKGYNFGAKEGDKLEQKARAALIAHVEGMIGKNTYKVYGETFKMGFEEKVCYNQALDDILSFLREPDASQGCCEKCADYTESPTILCASLDCPCHKKEL